MKSTNSDYTKLTILFILLIASTIVYTTAYYKAEQARPVFVGIVFTVLATFTGNSLTTIYLNNVYKKVMAQKHIRFYGRKDYLYNYQNNTGEMMRGTIFFLLGFTAPSLVVKDAPLVVFFLTLTLVFVFGTIYWAAKFTTYLKSHILIVQSSKPNSP